MNPAEDQNKPEPLNTVANKDVLGLDKPSGNSTGSKANPKRIFIVLGILALVVLIYWLYSK
jgi:hypothetical protein